jgi:hypothetical protein
VSRRNDDLVALVPAADDGRRTARKKCETTRAFFSCVPEGRASRAASIGCTMGNDDPAGRRTAEERKIVFAYEYRRMCGATFAPAARAAAGG